MHVLDCCVGLCIVLFPDGLIKKDLQGRSFDEGKKGLQDPSDTWSFRLVLVPGSFEFLDPEGFRLPEFGVSGF